MSIVLQSSSGGSITVQEPATASNFTQTLPAATGEVMVTGNMPAFSAYSAASQSFSSANTYTKVTYDTEEFDTNNNFASSRFTPTVAGYYQISAGLSSNTSSNYMSCAVYKNGSSYKRGANYSTTVASPNAAVSALVYCNGTTDYVEIFGVSANTFSTFAGIDTVYFQGVLVRAA
jgi:hypothetical protein